MPGMNDSLGAFCRHCDVRIEGAAGGPLGGLTFAAKDNFDVAGFSCCAGNPGWLRTHPPAQSTAPAIRMLLEAGATLAGKTKACRGLKLASAGARMPQQYLLPLYLK